MPSSKGMGFYWGSYVHPPGEVYPAGVQTRYMLTEDGIRWAKEVIFTVKGDFIGQTDGNLTKEEIDAKILELDRVYDQDFQDCGFTMNGDLTSHRMANLHARNLSGNRVIYKSWDDVYHTPERGHGVEYANTRSFTIRIRSVWLIAQSLPDVVKFQERVEKIGTGGPSFITYNTVPEPVRVDFLPKTIVRHVQQGYVIGTLRRIDPPPPLWPDEEVVSKRRIATYSPQFYGSPGIRLPTQYRTDFYYEFWRLGPDPVTNGVDWWPGA